MSDPYDALMKAEKVLERHEFAALVDLLASKDSQIAKLTSENTRLRNWVNTLEETMRAQGVCLCTFAQKTTGDGCQVCELPPSHKGED